MINGTVAVIMPHQAAQEAFDRHMPFWEFHGLPIVVAQSEDAPVKTQHSQFCYGKSCYAGPESKGKILKILNWFAGSGYENIILFEYDSIWFKKELRVYPGLHGVIRPNEYPERFIASHYALPPLTLDVDSAVKIIGAALKYPDINDEYFGDRFIASWAVAGCVPLIPISPVPGFGEQTFNDEHKPMLEEKIRKGSRAFHGIKTKEMLDFIVHQCRNHHAELPSNI